MSKSLTLSMSLALALGFSGVSFAGHGTPGCDTCGLSSPQGVVSSPQASPQGYETCDTCTAKKHFKFTWPACLKPKPKMYTYEWVLKKKRVWGHHEAACDTCGSPVTPSAQYSSPQAYGSHQSSMMPPAEMKPAMTTPTGDSVPPPPPPTAPTTPPATTPPSAAQGSLLFLAPTGN